MKGKLARSCSSGERTGLVTRFCHLVVHHHIVDKVLRSLQTTGRTRIDLETDGEPAIVQLQERKISSREQDTIAVNPSAYDCQSSGLAEKAVQDVKAQLRVLKLELEARIEHSIPMETYFRMDDTTFSRCNQPIQRWEGRQDAPLSLVFETVQVKGLRVWRTNSGKTQEERWSCVHL